jgi:hypothetical protein
MIYPELSKELIELKEKDLKLRYSLIKQGKLFNGYNAEMEEIHLSNANGCRDGYNCNTNHSPQ